MTIIETTINTTLAPGSPLINVFGDLIGVGVGAAQSGGNATFIAASDIAVLLAPPKATSTPSQ